MLYLLLTSLPTAQAAGGFYPTGRWGHRAVYVDSQQAMYVVGGEVSGSGSSQPRITNDVLVLSLNSSSPGWTLASSSGLPAHAFASMALSRDSSTITVVGGMTSSCSGDATTHSLDLSTSTWSSANPNGLVRRHGASAVAVNDGSDKGQLMVVGGLADKYVCYSGGVAGYTAFDTLALPPTSSGPKSVSLPTALTGAELAVSDFAMATTSDKLYVAGGQATDGTLVDLSTIGVWDSKSGWTSQTTSGDVPTGRLGSTLVGHPTSNMLVLYGGSTVNNGTFTPSSDVSVLDTKTWKWSSPSGLQSASAVAYHTSVSIPSGIMITTFGLESKGSPSSQLRYLDMRSSKPSDWTWQSHWTPDMLNTDTVSANETAHKSGKSKTVAAVVPTVILLLILIPLGVFLFRRHQRNARKRRLASHYCFNTQEDNGDFSRGLQPRRSRFRLSGNRDANEKESSMGSYVSSMRDVIYNVFRRNSNHGVGDDGTIDERQMGQVRPAQLNEKGMNWEEIDFGLGRVDQERREGTYTELPRRVGTPRAPPRASSADAHPITMPVASTLAYAQGQNGEGATGQLVDVDSSPRLGSPKSDGQGHLVTNNTPAAADANEWDQLQTSLSKNPAFRAISSTTQLRSHQHEDPFADPVSNTSVTSHSSHSSHSHSPAASETPSLPPLEFPNTPLSASPSPRSRVVSGASTRQLTHNRRSSHAGAPPSPTKHRRSSINSLGLQTNNRMSAMSRLRVVNGDEQ